ncbi:unnamed protein product [Rotaria magnacalcarata]|uniref:Uncharacterized protein n=2 Tax=Rotaria magnacalcarata TaxID=392030 RepID=A0A816BC96_9BILA|nr:unnamed protein product [Rotaria magnacalcarata]CAF4108287.1 unnamed protein product [Rotaria magnacalcarata]
MYNKQQLMEMIRNENSNVEFSKPKNVTSKRWNNYLQVFISGIQQNFIKFVNCQTILAWKSSHGTNVMEKHDKGCKNVSSPLNMQQSIKSYRSTNNENDQRLIRSIKRKLTNTIAVCCACDDLTFSSVKSDGFRVLVQDLVEAGR